MPTLHSKCAGALNGTNKGSGEWRLIDGSSSTLMIGTCGHCVCLLTLKKKKKALLLWPMITNLTSHFQVKCAPPLDGLFKVSNSITHSFRVTSLHFTSTAIGNCAFNTAAAVIDCALWFKLSLPSKVRHANETETGGGGGGLCQLPLRSTPFLFPPFSPPS